MAPDGRKPWEVEWCLRLKVAASYLDMAEATGHRRDFLMTAYNTGDLREWCNKRIASILKKCEALVQEHGQPSATAHAMVQGDAKKLQKVVLPGIVPGIEGVL